MGLPGAKSLFPWRRCTQTGGAIGGCV